MKKVIKNKTLRTICYVLAGVLIVGALVGLFSLFNKKAEETTKSISPSYAVGGLTAQGKYEETKGSIYTKNAFECYGLKTTLAFENDISYKLYFYDEDNNFISASNKLTDSYNSADNMLPSETKFCRIVITPNEDESVSWFEIGKYAKQLDIQVAKNQDVALNVMPKNYLVMDANLSGKACLTTDAGETWQAETCNAVSTSVKINVAGKSFVKVVALAGHNHNGATYQFVDNTNKIISGGFYSLSLQDNGDYSCELSVPANATGFYIALSDCNIDLMIVNLI